MALILVGKANLSRGWKCASRCRSLKIQIRTHNLNQKDDSLLHISHALLMLCNMDCGSHLVLCAKSPQDRLVHHPGPVGGPHDHNALAPVTLHPIPQLHEFRFDLIRGGSPAGVIEGLG